MRRRSLSQTVVRSLYGVLTTNPKNWYRKWLKAHRCLPDSRSNYLTAKAHYFKDELIINGWEVMQDWERPIMLACAEEAARNRGHVLEVGFGMGISAGFLVQRCSEYTCIEPHPDVLKHGREWAKKQPIPIHFVEGFWEGVIDNVGVFDGILFDIFPVSKPEQNLAERGCIKFTVKAAEHLRPGGVFTFYGGYPDRLPLAHEELIKRHFSSFEIRRVTGLQPPADNKYYHHASMVVPICTK